jgi:hypothetical protein
MGLKTHAGRADDGDVRVDRLAIDGGEGATFTLDLHPRLTVVAGIGRAERDSLVAELVGALGGARPGVHVEVQDRDGRHLAAFRPAQGRARVVDVDTACDVSHELQGPDGRPDLLSRLGLDVATARGLMRFTAADLETTTAGSETVDRLAAVDQEALWAAAAALSSAEDELSSESEALGTAPEDAELIDEIENRHVAMERAAERFEIIRRYSFYVSGLSGILTVPAAVTFGVIGLVVAALAAGGALASVVAWRRMVRATRAEEEALAGVGVQSYLGFQLQRVNSLLGDDSARRRLLDAADARRTAVATWERLAGDLPVQWALQHREEIEAAAGLHRNLGSLGTLSSSSSGPAAHSADDLGRALVDRLGRVRSTGGEGLPLLLDDPFRGVDPQVKPALLELLSRAAGDPQIVFLTDDEDVASWARLEVLTGDVALVEPVAERAHITI